MKTAPRHVEMEEVIPAVGPTVPVTGECACPRPRIPLHAVVDGLAQVRTLVAGALPAATPLFTLRCKDCKRAVILTAADVRLADGG